MTDFVLVTGFLGSGKTSLIKNWLQTLSPDIRLAVIQNEFAPTGVDGKELRRTGKEFRLVEINNGSVFCVCMMTNFPGVLEKLMDDYHPDIIILEASGLADPVNLIELLGSGRIRDRIRLSRIICLVDAPNFKRGMNTLTRVRHQVMIADTILINKTDLVEKDLNPVHAELEKLNPFADRVETTFGKFDIEGLSSDRGSGHPSLSRFEGQKSGDRPGMHVSVLRTGEKIPDRNLEPFISLLQESCLRIKGFLNTESGKVIAVQSVFGHLRFQEIRSYLGASELIIFSEKTGLKDLRQIFRKYAVHSIV